MFVSEPETAAAPTADEAPTLAQQQVALRARMEQAAIARQEALHAAAVALENTLRQAKQTGEVELKQIAQQRTQAQREAEQLRDERTRRLNERLNGEYHVLENEYQHVVEQIRARYQHENSLAKRELKERSWETQTVFDATKYRPKQELTDAEKKVTARAERLELIATAAKEHLTECQLYRDPKVNTDVEIAPIAEPLQLFEGSLVKAEKLLEQLKLLKLPLLIRSGFPIWLFALLWAVAALGLGLPDFSDFHFIWQSGVAALVLDIIVSVTVFSLARKHVNAVYDPLCQLLLEAEHARQQWHEAATEKCHRETNAILQKYRTDLHQAKMRFEERKDAATTERNTHTNAAKDKYEPQLAKFREFQTHESRDLVVTYERREREIAAEFATRDKQARERAEQAQRDAQAGYDTALVTIKRQWQETVRSIQAEAKEICDESDVIFPPWNEQAWARWTPPRVIAPVLRFGQYELPILSGDEPPPSEFTPRVKPPVATLPALLQFPDRCSLQLRAAGTGRLRAVDTLQSVMLRFLTAVPPGKVRFTIIDPVGLGQNFAGFMHLADYDELLVNHKIWTEPSQIEQRLADLSAHMSNVIQKYLRNEFETIDDYNQYAGEVAEPYRVLVVANFPFNFTETATRHLVSIATTGARCGVYTLISVDTKLTTPHGFRASELDQSCVKLVWRDGDFVWRDDDYEQLKLTVDGAPEPELFKKIVQTVGVAAKDSNRVEVPFDFIAPKPEDWWKASTASGIDVPLGRAGATKRQHMTLGRGTSQHVLVAGKTGSGKSTLMHALITNTALMYSPDEVELYLIDFKKGVEFKTYAQYALPHARVVAIESEREFGLSVLQRLDLELKQRGELFRDLNVQDLPNYREATGKHLPRILLVVDEFQEFFVEDDKIAQDVSLLLDRLVRQGRAFGIHVHLGSQTLGGAFSLPRATLGQMAVRVALQCSEADANLILSEENPAARLLTRPGEAIYNDANGRSEGNHLFQVVWLSEERREDYLRKLHDLAVARGLNGRTQIVFEGNVPADVRRNDLLTAALHRPQWPERVLAATTWLGEAIAIKDPTAIVFRAQSGNNVALIGQQSEAALAMMLTMLVSLSAQHSPAKDEPPEQRPRFIVADGQAPDAIHAGRFQRLADHLTHKIEVIVPRDMAAIIDSVATEVERRQTLREAELPPIYLFVYDLQRFRDLRKADDDFSFSRETKVSPAKQFVSILKDGPASNVHVIVWSDSLNNMQRAFDRPTMREFESRVLFQMSVTDSSSLIDSPAASKLGPHRALLHSEEEGRLEKFRPYSLPEDSWLREVGERLDQRRADCGVRSAES